MRRSVSDAGVGTPAGGVKMAAVVERFAERVVSASGRGTDRWASTCRGSRCVASCTLSLRTNPTAACTAAAWGRV